MLSMKNNKTQWGVIALVAFIGLFLAALALPPLPTPKGRASRITGVNHISSVSMTIASTNALPAPGASK